MGEESSTVEEGRSTTGWGSSTVEERSKTAEKGSRSRGARGGEQARRWWVRRLLDEDVMSRKESGRKEKGLEETGKISN